MRKLLLSAVTALSINATAQEAFISASFDLRNAVIGSTPTGNKPAADLLLKCGMVGEKGFEIQVQYENFKRIDFVKYGVNFGHKIPITDNLSVSPLAELAFIKRDWGGDVGEVANGGAGAAVSVRYYFSDRFGIELFTEQLFRGDLDWRYGSGAHPWVTSVYGGLTYRID